jgi:hypothetical protein
MLKRYKNEVSLRSMKKYIITIYLYDQAYREFFNILMHELARGMMQEYTKPEYIKQAIADDQIVYKYSTGHLFFTTDIYDVNYYVLEKQIRYQTEYSVEKQGGK